MARLTRDHLVKKRQRDDVVTLPDGDVKVRSLSRAEALAVNDRDGLQAKEAFIVATGMVDPEMTEEDVAAWQASPGGAGELELVSRRITELSGMGEAAGKAAYKSPRGRR